MTHEKNTRHFFINDRKRNIDTVQREYCTNWIRTTKYTLWNFLPYSLFSQFRNLANSYFLVAAIVQSWPAVSPLNPVSAIIPLVIVVGISMLREAVEDVIRYRSDQKSNGSKTKAFR